MIKIQYAIFLSNIEADEAGRPVLKNPVTNLATRDISAKLTIQFPLFVTFVDGAPGEHEARIDIVSPNGSVNSLPGFEFDWSEGQVTRGEIFPIKFEPDAIGIYTFRLIVDDEVSTEIPLPVILQE